MYWFYSISSTIRRLQLQCLAILNQLIWMSKKVTPKLLISLLACLLFPLRMSSNLRRYLIHGLFFNGLEKYSGIWFSNLLVVNLDRCLSFDNVHCFSLSDDMACLFSCNFVTVLEWNVFTRFSFLWKNALQKEHVLMIAYFFRCEWFRSKCCGKTNNKFWLSTCLSKDHQGI